ncbi:MAG: hypothetical protein NTW29_10240, partial [Bacteroidetes bacterium]|nr:hypothetical protein [Bacteroidota bacterium]
PGNAWVTVKAVGSGLFALAWLLAIGWLVKLAAWWWRRVKWRNASLASVVHAQQEVKMTYDADGFRFEGNYFDSGFKWELFEYYTVHKGSLYLFTIPALYESLFFAPQEVGEEHYQALVRLAKERLKQFPVG